jgi:D-glycero-alpha-D-manno-heptose-7-phosphate kinase
MIIARTPFRVSFSGGGSDLAAFYSRHYGAVISTAINKFIYVMVHPCFYNRIRIKCSKAEEAGSPHEVCQPLVRECLKLMKIGKGVEIASIADVPEGTGLGSSSAFTVGLLNALAAYQRKNKSRKWLAENACTIEIDKVGEPIGRQDQFAVSFGGLNYIRFNPKGRVEVEPINLTQGSKQKLERSLLMFYVGNQRKASAILWKQKRNIETGRVYKKMCQMVRLTEDLKKFLLAGKIETLGEILHQGWLLKKCLAGKISDAKLDSIYNRALKAGASGGKLLGAGGGGFFLFYCEPRYQDKLRQSLKLRELKFAFDNEGTKIIHTDEGDNSNG